MQNVCICCIFKSINNNGNLIKIGWKERYAILIMLNQAVMDAVMFYYMLCEVTQPN